MQWFSELPSVYIHRDAVDFRKAVNGLSDLIEQDLGLNPFDDCLYVFCNRSRDRLKILHWDRTGFVLWYKRLEKEKFKWPSTEEDEIIKLSERSFQWLLSGLPIRPPEPHKSLHYEPLS